MPSKQMIQMREEEEEEEVPILKSFKYIPLASEKYPYFILSLSSSSSMATTMEANPLIPMERTTNIIRKSIHTYLKHYQYFTFTAALLVFPVSITLLLSQAFIPFSSPLLPTIYTRLQTIFYAAGFPSSSQFFSILTLKLSQTICSSIFILPLSLSFLLVTKAAIIQALHHQNESFPPSISSFFTLYVPLLHTYLCNSFVIIAANAVALTLLFLVFNSLEAFNFSSPNSLLSLSAAGAVVYSVILANALVVCNLALIVAGMENSGGYLAIFKACVLIRGRTSTALLLALPFNLGLAAVEALFQYRVVRIHLLSDNNVNCYSMASEGLLIAYLYSILIVLDTITTCIFYKSCKLNSQIDQDDKYYCLLQLALDEDHGIFGTFKTFEELP